MVGGITAEKLFHMMKDQMITTIVMDARSQRDFVESHIQVPSQACISVPEDAIRPGYDTRGIHHLIVMKALSKTSGAA